MTLPVLWNLQNIEKVARQVSGQLSALQFSNVDLDFNINSYYQYDLPRELKIEELYVEYTFPLVVNKAVYELPGDFKNQFQQAFTHVEPKIYLNGCPIFYTQDTNQFYYRVPKLFSTEIIGYGDGLQTNFIYTTINKPIVPNQIASVLITDEMQSFQDNGLGNLTDITTGIGGATDKVTYLSGLINITFSVAPAINQPVTVTYHYQQLSRPNTVLFYGREFTFYPTPDTTYQVRIDAYQQPPRLVNPNDVPVKPEWGEIIAIGAAMKILRNFGQFDKYQEMKPYYEKERTKLMSDTDNQLMASRSPQTC